MLDGEIVPYDQPFTAGGAPIMFPGDPSAPPAMVYNCRCTMQTGNDIELEAEPHEMRVRDPITGRNIVVTEEGFEEWKQKNWGVTPKKVANPSNDVIIKSGAVSGALTSKNDPEFKKRQAFAESYYAEIRARKREYEIEAVSRNSGFSKEEIDRVFSHVFELEHLYDDGTIHRFHTDYDMAQSWMRLREGKNILEHDIILIRHELMESEIMGKGTTIPYEPVHYRVSEVYNYKAALIKYLTENDLL